MPMTNRQEVMKRVEALNVIDDALFQKMAEDAGFCEEFSIFSSVEKQCII